MSVPFRTTAGGVDVTAGTVIWIGAVGGTYESGIIQSVATMKNDYERANVLIDTAKGASFDAALRKAYLDAADTIRSAYDKNRVLAALARTHE